MHFIRKQIIVDALIKALTTKVQRGLAHRQFALMLGVSDNDKTTTETDYSSFEFPKTIGKTEANSLLVRMLDKKKVKIDDELEEKPGVQLVNDYFEIRAKNRKSEIELLPDSIDDVSFVKLKPRHTSNQRINFNPT